METVAANPRDEGERVFFHAGHEALKQKKDFIVLKIRAAEWHKPTDSQAADDIRREGWAQPDTAAERRPAQRDGSEPVKFNILPDKSGVPAETMRPFFAVSRCADVGYRLSFALP